MGCGKSKLDAVATGNTTSASKQSNAAEDSGITKNGSATLKALMSKKNVNVGRLSQKVLSTVAAKGKLAEIGKQAREGKAKQGNGAVAAKVEMEAITKDPETEEVDQKKEVKRDVDEVGVTNAEGDVMGTAGVTSVENMPNGYSGTSSEMRLEPNEIVKAAHDVMEEKVPVEETRDEELTAAAGEEVKAPVEAKKEDNSSIEETKEEAKVEDEEDSNTDEENKVSLAAEEENKTA